MLRRSHINREQGRLSYPIQCSPPSSYSFFLCTRTYTSAASAPFPWLSLASLVSISFTRSSHCRCCLPAMESSHITGDDGEGCNSSESGWTMYLASPMQGGADDDDDGSRKGSGSDGSNVDDGYGYTYILRGKKGGKEYHDDGDDNNSLASDASTGPAKVKVQHPQSPDGKQNQGHRKNGDNAGEKREEDDEEEDDMRTRFSTSSRKKAGNKAEKGGEGKSSKKRGSSSRTSFFW